MYEIRKTPKFDAWLCSIRDPLTKKRLIVRLRKATLGSLGDVKPLGDGIWEFREDFGPGWRMYFAQYGKVIILMLGEGCKSTQAGDIKKAKKLIEDLEV